MTPPVVVWRHGRSEWNAAGRFQGHLESNLDPVGIAQVAAAAAVLALREPTRLVTSPAVRALHTADALAHRAGLEAVVDERMREVDVGEWGGLTHEEVRARFPETYAAWRDGHGAPGGAEPLESVAHRSRECIEEHLELATGPGPLVVVTHGGTAISLLAAVLGLSQPQRRMFAGLENAHWLALSRGRHGWRLLEHNANAGLTATMGLGPHLVEEAGEMPAGTL